MHSFTTEDLLQYLYKETSPEKTAAIRSALDSDWNLREKFEQMASASNNMDTVSYSPRQQSLDFILNYAEKAHEELASHI